MNLIKQTFRLTALMLATLVLTSCSKDDDSTTNPNTNNSVNIEEGRITFDISNFENTTMNGDVEYFLNNSYPTKYFSISNVESMMHNDRMWGILIEQHSNDDIVLPQPGEYPIVQGLANTYDQTSFNITVSMFTDTMTDTGLHFGGNSGDITGTLKIVSITNNIVKGTFNFEAYASSGQKIIVTNGKFAAPKHSW